MTRPSPQTLVLATTNPGKRAEFERLLPPSVRLLTLAETEIELPPETGTTFAENARAKASAAADQSGLLALADDSGLIVDHLGDLPGVRSARFGGEPPSDERNRAALLLAMQGLSGDNRAASFVCAVALARPGTLLDQSVGVCHGSIAETEHGEHGFGYDPLFVLPDGRTMAELPLAEKNQISHRAIAYRRLLPALLRELDVEPSAHGGH